MRRSDAIELTLPADLAYASVADYAVRDFCSKAGFDEADVNRVCLAAEEALNHALEFGYGGPQERIRLEIDRSSFGVRLTLRFRGIPLDVSQLPGYDPLRAVEHCDTMGMSLLLLEAMMDKTSYAVAAEGVRIVTMEKNLPALPMTERDAVRETAEATGRPELTLRLALPEDAESISRLAFRAHGSVLFSEHIYYPERVRSMLESGEMTSVVLQTAAGRLAGHGALLRYYPAARVEEATFAFIDPAFRGCGGAERMAEHLEENARSRSVQAIQAFAVTSHVHSQRAVFHRGFAESALLLDFSSAAHSWEKTPDSAPSRIATLLFVKRLNPLGEERLHFPARHREMLGRIYANARLDVATADDASWACAPGAESSVWDQSDFMEGWAVIGVDAYGEDVAVQVAERLRRACAQRLSTVQLLLPLRDPGTGAMPQVFEEMGFFFSGVAFWGSGDECLLLQHVTGSRVNYENIHVCSDFGNDLKQYVRSCDPNA